MHGNAAEWRGTTKACMHVSAGLKVPRTVSVAVRPLGRMGTGAHGHIADSVRAKERSVEPVALPIRARFVRLGGRRTAAYPGRPVFRRPDRARQRAGLVRTRGCGWLPDRPAPSHRGSTEGMAGCASPPPEWKTSTVPWRSGLCPDLDAAASRGVMQQGFPVSPVRDWIRRSRSCAYRGLAIDLSCTCCVPAPASAYSSMVSCSDGVASGAAAG